MFPIHVEFIFQWKILLFASLWFIFHIDCFAISAVIFSWVLSISNVAMNKMKWKIK